MGQPLPDIRRGLATGGSPLALCTDVPHPKIEEDPPLSSRGLSVWMLLLMSACAPARWTKPNATSSDLDHDAYECEGDSEAMPVRKNQFAATAQQDCFRRCMQMKGWTKAK